MAIETEEEKKERLKEAREERRRQRRGWQLLICYPSGGMYMNKRGDIKQYWSCVEGKYHYNAGGKAFCGVSLHIAEEVPAKDLRKKKYMRCQKCLAALRHAIS